MERARPLVGTMVSVRVGGAPDAAIAMEAAFSAVAKVERLMSCHDPESELSRLNRAAHLRALPVDPWTWRVFRLAVILGRRSAGALSRTRGARPGAPGPPPPPGGHNPAAKGGGPGPRLPPP